MSAALEEPVAQSHVSPAQRLPAPGEVLGTAAGSSAPAVRSRPDTAHDNPRISTTRGRAVGKRNARAENQRGVQVKSHVHYIEGRHRMTIQSPARLYHQERSENHAS